MWKNFSHQDRQTGFQVLERESADANSATSNTVQTMSNWQSSSHQQQHASRRQAPADESTAGSMLTCTAINTKESSTGWNSFSSQDTRTGLQASTMEPTGSGISIETKIRTYIGLGACQGFTMDPDFVENFGMEYEANRSSRQFPESTRKPNQGNETAHMVIFSSVIT